MKHLKIISFSHKQIDLAELGKLVICQESLDDRLRNIQSVLQISEVFYLATCNRVEFVFSGAENVDEAYARRFLETMDMGLPADKMDIFLKSVCIHQDVEALNHLLRMSCSLESLVVGEKEILAQLRRAFDSCKEAGFTGDFLRLVMDRVVKTAKEVYTHTNISKNPVSVVSLAYRKLRDLKMCSNSRILIIGAGETNNNLAKYLQKHKYSNFSVFNRTLANAEKLAKDLGGEAYKLSELKNFNKGFDVIITCTSATEPIITAELYKTLLNGEEGRKVIVDLAVPNDTAAEVIEQYPITFIDVKTLKEIAQKNIQERYQELVHAERIIEENIKEFEQALKQRRVEVAMRIVPEKIKEIRHNALNTVFVDEFAQLDANSKEVLEKIMSYMEKKYISVPMIMAKEILVNNS